MQLQKMARKYPHTKESASPPKISEALQNKGDESYYLMAIAGSHSGASYMLAPSSFTRRSGSSSKTPHTSRNIIKAWGYSPFFLENTSCLPPIKQIAL
jgi:hypothetical protein